MRINKDKLAELLALSDDELWLQVVALAAQHGYTLSPKTPPPAEMARLRGAVSGGAKLNLAEAVRILNEYKRGSKK